jgi:hypothetical protein
MRTLPLSALFAAGLALAAPAAAVTVLGAPLAGHGGLVASPDSEVIALAVAQPVSGEAGGGLAVAAQAALPWFYDGATGVFMSFSDRIGHAPGRRPQAPATTPLPEADALLAASFDGIDRIGVIFGEQDRTPRP